MRVRRVAACAAVLLALAGLSACRTKTGAAAFVGGDRITDGDVGKYLTVKSAPYTVAADPNSGQPASEVRPKTLVLSYLIKQRLFEKAVAANGGPATQAELDAARDQVLQGATDEQLAQQMADDNYKKSFEPVYLKTQELLGVFAQRAKAQTIQDLANNLHKLGIGVTVSARYGTWNATELTLQNGLDPDLSGVLTLDSTAPAPPAS